MYINGISEIVIIILVENDNKMYINQLIFVNVIIFCKE
jgi:hypothetical protein